MKRFLVIGYPRSGTSYAAVAFHKSGMYVTHERDEKAAQVFCGRRKAIDGMVGGLFMNTDRDFDKYDVIFHQTRHPLDVISSACAMKWRSMQDLMVTCGIESWNGESKLYRVMKTWLLFTEWADSLAHYRYPVEDMRQHWKPLLRRIGVLMDRKFPDHMWTYMNTYKNKPPKQTWDDLFRCDKAMTERIRERTEAYGYTL